MASRFATVKKHTVLTQFQSRPLIIDQTVQIIKIIKSFKTILAAHIRSYGNST
jgi:hypothetical protein